MQHKHSIQSSPAQENERLCIPSSSRLVVLPSKVVCPVCCLSIAPHRALPCPTINTFETASTHRASIRHLFAVAMGAMTATPRLFGGGGSSSFLEGHPLFFAAETPTGLPPVPPRDQGVLAPPNTYKYKSPVDVPVRLNYHRSDTNLKLVTRPSIIIPE